MLFLTLGWVCLLLGLIGIFLPLLPTTPFALLAAYFFSGSSQRMHNWLLQQKTLGPLLREWEAHGIIPLKAKWMATLAIVCLFSSTLIFVKVVPVIKIVVACIGFFILGFIWTRPGWHLSSTDTNE